MAKYVTLSVKVRSELKQKLKALGIKPSAVLRKAIEDEIRRREVGEVKERVKEAKELFGRIPMGDVIDEIRKDREER